MSANRPKYKRKTDWYVWCDSHGAIHDKVIDVFNEGKDPHDLLACAPECWRPVYIGTDDPHETF